jgi:ATP-dependent helicase HrpA
MEHPLATELASLVPPRFLERITFEGLLQLPRYLKALLIRAERAALNPVKDQERARLLAPYVAALKQLENKPAETVEARAQRESYRHLGEEYKVSIFAQELGTAIPVSPQRLDRQLEAARHAA